MEVQPKILLIFAALIMMASAFLGGAPGPANAARSKTPATIAHSARELDAAIDLFARFTPELLKPNKPATVEGHRIKPAFSPLHFVHEGSEGDFLTHLVGSLISGEMDELQMSLDVGYDPTFSLPAHTLTSLKNAIDTEKLINSTAFIEGGIQRQTDVLVRPLPLGFSFYLQFRSRASPERVTIASNVLCAPIGSEIIRRMGAGTFIVEGIADEEGECKPYSRARIPAKAPPAPSDSSTNYKHEMRILRVAQGLADKDGASVIAVLSAATAYDATGQVVPTDLAWREEPALRVHHRNGNYHYPIVARLDFIIAPQ